MTKFMTLVLAAAVFYSAVQVILAQHEARGLFVQIQDLEKTRDQLDEEWGRLQLEQSTWTTADRIERLATTELDMVGPEINSIVLITR